MLRDALTGVGVAVRARVVVNAAGVWAGELDPASGCGRAGAPTSWSTPQPWAAQTPSLTVPVPGRSSRFVFTLPRRTAASTSASPTAADGPAARRAASDRRRDRHPARHRQHGARPRRSTAPTCSARSPGSGRCSAGDATTARRRHLAPARDPRVAGRPAERRRRQAHDLSPDGAGRRRRRRRARRSARRARLAHTRAPARRSGRARASPRSPPPARFVRRYGAEAPFAAALPDGPAGRPRRDRAGAALGLAVEGALDVDDLLDRRTRLGLVPADERRRWMPRPRPSSGQGSSRSDEGSRRGPRARGVGRIRMTTADRRQPTTAAAAQTEK